MERVCFLLHVRPECLEEYTRRHELVWPEMLQALQDAGWRNYSLFLNDDGLLVGYLESDDYALALERMAGSEVNQRWQTEMARFFADLGDMPPDRGPRRLTEIFHLP